jgi:ubiquinone/menaquinone biosynthesis C-methylase UbiE
MAESFDRLAATKAENAYIDQPTIRRQIGEVGGLKVLDAGCGPGILAAYLVSRGARVTAFDVSPKMVGYADRRLKGSAKVFVADMAKPLSSLSDGEFDLVVSSLAIDYVRDWSQPLAEFRRVLKPGGRFVFTAQNPISSFQWDKPPSPFGIHYTETLWKSFGGEPVMMPGYYRSFEAMVTPILQAGFIIRSVVDSVPVEALKEVDPAAYEKFMKIPFGMCFEVAKPL